MASLKGDHPPAQNTQKADKSKPQQNKQGAEEKEEAHEKEPQPSTGGAKDRGGKKFKGPRNAKTGVEETDDKEDSIAENQAQYRKKGKPDMINDIKKSKQDAETARRKKYVNQ